MKRTMMIAMLSACVIALGAACGDDGETDGNNTGGTGGGNTGGSAGDSGEGGSGGSDSGGSGGSTGGSGGSTGGSGGSTGGSGGGAAEPVVCGGETCDPPMNPRLRACCVEGTDECGEKIPGGFVGGDCVLPVVSHPDCEEGTLMGLGGSGMMIPSCCTPEGACGLTAPLLGFDCTSIEEIVETMNPDGGVDGGSADGGMPPRVSVTPPAPATCTP
jgi:hypothetical protein